MQPLLSEVSHPGHISVGPSQHGRWCSDRTKYRKLPDGIVCGVDQLDPVRPWSDVEAAGFIEVEQHGPSVVQEGEDPHRPSGGHQIEIGHSTPEQRVSIAKVVVD